MSFSLKIIQSHKYRRCSLFLSLSFFLLSFFIFFTLFSSSFKQISHFPIHPTFSRASPTFKYYSRSKSYSLAFPRNPSLSLSIRARRLVISISFARIVKMHGKSLRMPDVPSRSLSLPRLSPPPPSPNAGFICRRTCLPSSRRRARPRWRQTAEEKRGEARRGEVR